MFDEISPDEEIDANVNYFNQVYQPIRKYRTNQYCNWNSYNNLTSPYGNRNFPLCKVNIRSTIRSEGLEDCQLHKFFVNIEWGYLEENQLTNMYFLGWLRCRVFVVKWLCSLNMLLSNYYWFMLQERIFNMCTYISPTNSLEGKNR